MIWSVDAAGSITSSQLLYAIAQVLCNNRCGKPEGLPDGVGWTVGSNSVGDCEISVAVAGGVEAVCILFHLLLLFEAAA